MKQTGVYKRKLRTTRRFIFENIFDLEHVCVLHRRWFSNLRIRAQRSDYVEYRLTSWFYGLRQEILVRGAPIDENRYWYEFLGRFARIRVEGLIEGPDGNVLLNETISYQYPWPLAPLFFILRPLFQRQKEDILLADGALLERVYELEQRGFQRLEVHAPRVVVYGGDGFFGRLVIQDLLKHCDAHIVIASRRPKLKDFPSSSPRLTFVESDLNDYKSVLETVKGAQAAVCCVGPYQGLTLNLLYACIEKKVHYVDVADDRDFVERCYALRPEVERAGVMAFIGCSVVPGMSTLLCAYAQHRLPCVDKIRIFITPGTRHPRGAGSFLCLLSTVGIEFSIPIDGLPQKIKGWTGRERVEFPPPLGDRWVYFVVDIPDYFLQPLYFNTRTVDFKIGSEIDFLNRCLTVTRWLKELLGNPDWRWFTPVAQFVIHLASLLGTSRGGVMVEVSGSDATGKKRSLTLSVFAPVRGESIPAILPSVATQLILTGELKHSGIVPLPNWLQVGRLARELHKREVQLALKENDSDEWKLFGPDDSSLHLMKT